MVADVAPLSLAQDIASSTNMAAPELRRTLQSLACAKYKVLTKSPKGRDVDDTDTFSFNSTFTSPLAKIKIQTIASKVETADERRETEEKVEELRNTQCDVRQRLSSPVCPR
jgi:cullin 3